MSRPRLHLEGQRCAAPDCRHDAERGRHLCRGHRARAERRQALSPLAERVADPVERLVVAAVELADADSEDEVDYHRRRRALLQAAVTYAHSLTAVDAGCGQ